MSPRRRSISSHHQLSLHQWGTQRRVWPQQEGHFIKREAVVQLLWSKTMQVVTSIPHQHMLPKYSGSHWHFQRPAGFTAVHKGPNHLSTLGCQSCPLLLAASALTPLQVPVTVIYSPNWLWNASRANICRHSWHSYVLHLETASQGQPRL